MEEASRNRSLVVEMNEEDDGDVALDDVEVLWDTLSNGFKRAQVVLDQNRELIRRVNENHMSRIPDNVATNVGLINQINGNIFRVMEIYSDLSVNFARSFNQRTAAKNGVRRNPSCSS